MAEIESGSVPRLSIASEERTPSPFGGHDHSKPHTSISSLPDVPTLMESGTARKRRRSETQELRTKVELLGTKVFS